MQRTVCSDSKIEPSSQLKSKKNRKGKKIVQPVEAQAFEAKSSEPSANKLKSEAEILTEAYNAMVDGLPWEMIASDPFYNFENFMVSRLLSNFKLKPNRVCVYS